MCVFDNTEKLITQCSEFFSKLFAEEQIFSQYSDMQN